jgi:hypothetical protein
LKSGVAAHDERRSPARAALSEQSADASEDEILVVDKEDASRDFRIGCLGDLAGGLHRRGGKMQAMVHARMDTLRGFSALADCRVARSCRSIVSEVKV